MLHNNFHLHEYEVDEDPGHCQAQQDLPVYSAKVVCKVHLKEQMHERQYWSRFCNVFICGRVLNDSQKTRLSCGRMIWLLPHPLPSASGLSFSVVLCVARRERGWGRSKIIRAREIKDFLEIIQYSLVCIISPQRKSNKCPGHSFFVPSNFQEWLYCMWILDCSVHRFTCNFFPT